MKTSDCGIDLIRLPDETIDALWAAYEALDKVLSDIDPEYGGLGEVELYKFGACLATERRRRFDEMLPEEACEAS